MNCPKCGSWSDVSETRPGPNGMIKRRRKCSNGHPFTTFEVLPQVVKAAGANVVATARAAKAASQRWARDKAIRKDVRSIPAIAAAHGLTVERVRQIRKSSA